MDCVSGASLWRGYDHFKANKVIELEEIGENGYSAVVKGNSKEPYSVELHIDHPRKSKCNCPHANGKRIICKHIVATYFAACPEEAEQFYKEVIEAQAEAERRREELEDKVIEYVGKMKKADLSQALLELLFDGPEWQYDRFVRENGLVDEWW